MAEQRTLQSIGVAPITQHSGMATVQRRVVVNAPGKFFTGLTPSEQSASYSVEAIEYKERHSFGRHAKAWGAPHVGPGIRFLSRSDAIDDPDHRGFWTTLSLCNRWRHETYKDNREAEKQFTDESTADEPRVVPQEELKKPLPAVKHHFTLVAEGTHTYGGNGKLAGQTERAFWFVCQRPGCPSSARERAIKQIGLGTGQLFTHLDSCQPALAKQLRSGSRRGNSYTDTETGAECVPPSTLTLHALP